MANAKLVDTATEADWGFFDDEGYVSSIRNAANRVAGMFSDADVLSSAEDLFHDGLLYVAVRPRLVKGPDEEESDRRAKLYSYVWGHLREQASRRKSHQMDSLDELVELEVL